MRSVVVHVWMVSVVLGVALPSGLAAQPSPPDAIFANGFEMPNQAPIADPGNDQTASVGSPSTLDGSGSSDPDGDPLSFAWSIVQRPTNSGTELFHADLADPVLIPDRAGVYVVQLVVSDGDLFSAPATIEVTATGALAGSSMIGPAGGAVGLPDGAGVLIPPGALDTATTIGIAEIPPPPGAMGGAGVATSDGNQHGGDAGNGGSILVDLGSNGVLTFRDVDLATGAEIGTLNHRFNLPPPDPVGPYSTCTSSGAHGGFGQLLPGAPSGNGGTGGMAGAITFTGGTLNPSPASSSERYTILGFPPTRLQQAFCARGTEMVGSVIEAFDSGSRPLYRVRVNTSRTALLGGMGGIPSGRTAGYPGDVGSAGATAPIAGLPVQ